MNPVSIFCIKLRIIPVIAHKTTNEILDLSVRSKASVLVASFEPKNLMIIDEPKPIVIPKIGAPTQPLKAISAYPDFASEQFTIKSGTELPTDKIVIARKDSFISNGNNN